jgi:hypothetical protein
VRLLSEVVLLCVVQEKKSSAESQAMFNGLLAEASVEAKALLQVETPLAAGVFLFFGWGGSPAMVGTRANPLEGQQAVARCQDPVYGPLGSTCHAF